MSARRTARVQTGRTGGRRTAKKKSKTPRVNMFGSRVRTHRKVPRGHLRRAPVGKIPDNYEHINTIIGDDEVGQVQQKEVIPTILPREPQRFPQINYARKGINPHDVPEAEDWEPKLFKDLQLKVKTVGDLKHKQKQMRLPTNNIGVVDVDGDGVIDEVEIRLGKILKHVEGVDLDGDGEVTAEETEQTRIMKGKEIYANTFVKENPGIRNFYKMYRYLTDDQIVHEIINAPDFCMNMHNMINAAAQYKVAGSQRMYNALAGQITGRQNMMTSIEQNRRTRRKQLFRQALSRHQQNQKLASQSVTFRKRFEGIPTFRAYAHNVAMSAGINRR